MTLPRFCPRPLEGVVRRFLIGRGSRSTLSEPTAAPLMKSSLFLSLVGVLFCAPASGQSVSPYFPDDGTVVLYHLDEAAGAIGVMDAAGNLDGVSTFGETPLSVFDGGEGFPGFGGAAGNVAGAGIGVDVNADGVFRYDDSGAADQFDTFGRLGSAFTLEAMIKVPSITSGSPQHIWGLDGALSRALQFRINGDGVLNFDPVDGGGAAVTADLASLTGTHAFAVDEWFHVAAVYDNGMVSLYWTRVGAATEANLIGTGVTAVAFQSDDSPLVLGNEGRSFGGMGEALLGRIDEARVSGIARAANEFIFDSVKLHSASSYETGSTNFPENTRDGDLNTRWSAFGDGEWIAYDLGKARVVTAVDVAFLSGDVRTSSFDIELSMDGVAWTPVLPGAVSSGSTLAAETFVLPANQVGRYVRYVGHGNSVNGWNSLTELDVQSAPVSDTDQDGLPDEWEQQLVAADPDDAIETIADVLPDDDFDSDGQSNLEEYRAGSDPAVVDTDRDTDGDGLPDLWEMNTLGSREQNAFDDADSDGFTNVAEYLASTDPLDPGSKPTWKPPAVGFMAASEVAADACIMPANATYGRAINGLSFQDQILHTFNGYQYTAYYDSIDSVQRVVLARRTVDGAAVGEWELHPTDSEFTRGDESSWDAHNVIAFGICETDGSLHFSWDHHGHTLRYRRSIAGLCTTNTAAWGDGMLLAEQNWMTAPGETLTDVTYPQFVSTPAGGLTFVWRNGSSGNGDQFFSHYVPGSENWADPVLFIQRGGNYNGSTSRCPYINGFDYSPDGTMHVSWTWREGAGSSNHDICYAYSEDAGVTWKNTAGSVVADTGTGGFISLDSPGIAFKPTDLNQLLINQQTQCVDSEGRVHVMMLHRREDPGYEYPNVTTAVYSTLATAYYHYVLEPGTGKWQQRRIPPDLYPVGSRPSIGHDAEGNVYAAFTTYPAGTSVFPGYTSGQLAIASASKTSQFTDWKVLQVVETSNQFTGEPLIDQARLSRDRVLSVYLQESSPSDSAGATPLRVFEFAVDVAEPPLPGSAAISTIGDDILVTTFGESGSSYQLQSGTDLVTDWQNIGTSYAGNGGLIAAPHIDGWTSSRRFYRFEVTVP